MAKTNISFNDKNYQVDDASLSEALAELRQHLSTVMNGTGATITLDGIVYSIDAAKLSAAEDEFESYLSAIGDDTPSEERLEGDGAEFYTLAPTALSFRSTAPLHEFQAVKVNGEVVDSSNYTLEEGSTIVKLSIDYLKTLPVGTYDIEVVSANNAPSGGFTVKSPELNEYGFYYNQPYVAYVDAFGGKTAFFYREDGTADTILLATGYIETVDCTCSGNTIIATTSMGTMNSTVSPDGTEVSVAEIATTFKLGDASIVADEDYIYTYKEDLGGYEVTAIDITKAEYGVIKTGINGIDTVKLANRMFYGCDSLVRVVIPDTVESIGNMAFYNCSSLTSITIPSSVTSIEHQAFSGCDSLASVVIPDGMTSIDSAVFEDCSSLMSVTIPDSVTSINSEAFIDCTSLTNITIPDSVTSINSRAFSGCTSLTNITIPNGVTSINQGVFKGCTNLVSVTMPDSVTSVDTFAFMSCDSLTSVTIPSGVTSIGREVFSRCTVLNDITFEGTIAQWNAITKGDHISDDWSGSIPATYVQCSDGQVAL
jgi:hypothetical protein